MADEPTKNLTLTILDFEFPVTAPYAAGHTLTDNEARALNQTRKENLGNNFRKAVKDAIEAAGGDTSKVDAEKLQSDFAALDTKYEFTAASVAASRKLEPWEREARNMVKAALRDHFSSLEPAQKFADLDEDAQEALIEANVSNPDIVKVAKNVVAQRQKAANISLNTGAPAAE